MVAPRRRFEGTVSYDPEADITPTIRSNPDAPEAGRNGVDRGKPRRVVELVHHVTVGLQGQPGTVTELARDIQPSARHAASTTSLAVVPKRRRGCEETGAAADDLLASQPTSPSREIRGERPT